MLKRVSFLVGYNLYESKRHFARKFTEALRRKDVEVTLVDVAPEKGLQKSDVEQIIGSQPHLTCSFHSIIPVEGGYYLCDFFKIPHISILVDPAIYSLDITRSPYSIASCVDRDDVKLLVDKGFEQVFFLPHAVEKEFVESPPKEKTFPVVFIGSCYDPSAHIAHWRERFPNPIFKVLEEASEEALVSSKATFVQTLVKAWDRSGLDPQGQDFIEFCHLVDGYVRAKDRMELIKSINCCEVHIFGDVGWQGEGIHARSWSQMTKDLPHVRWHRAVSFTEGLKILRSAKICLNSMPFFRDGSHERIFNGLGGRALVVTGESRYIEEEFPAGSGVEIYQYGQWNVLNEKIERYLKDDHAREAMVEKGREIVLGRHTWDQRALTFLDQGERLVDKIASSHYISRFSQ